MITIPRPLFVHGSKADACALAVAMVAAISVFPSFHSREGARRRSALAINVVPVPKPGVQRPSAIPPTLHTSHAGAWRAFEDEGFIDVIACSPDGQRLACGSEVHSGDRWTTPLLHGLISCWDVSAAKLLWRQSIAGPPTSICFSPDGKNLYHDRGDRDEMHDGYDERDAQSGQLRRTCRHNGLYLVEAVTPEGAGIRELSFDAGMALVFSPRGDIAAASIYDFEGWKVMLLDTVTWTVRRILKADTMFTRLEFSDDGHLLAGVGDAAQTGDTCLNVWDVGNGKLLRSTGYSGATNNAVEFAPGGTAILMGAGRRLDLRSGRVTVEQLIPGRIAHSASTSGLRQYNHGGTVFIWGDERSVYVWDYKLRKMVRHWTIVPGSEIPGCFWRRGKLIAVAIIGGGATVALYRLT